MTNLALKEVGSAEAQMLPWQHTSYLSLNLVRYNSDLDSTQWVGIKEPGRPKPALHDSGRPRMGLWLTFRMKNGKGLFKDLFILSANRLIFDCLFVHVMPK